MAKTGRRRGAAKTGVSGGHDGGTAQVNLPATPNTVTTADSTHPDRVKEAMLNLGATASHAAAMADTAKTLHDAGNDGNDATSPGTSTISSTKTYNVDNISLQRAAEARANADAGSGTAQPN